MPVGRKFQRCTACQKNSSFYRLRDAVQKHVSWNQFILRVDDADERTVDFFLYISHSVEKRTHRRSAGPCFILSLFIVCAFLKVIFVKRS